MLNCFFQGCRNFTTPAGNSPGLVAVCFFKKDSLTIAQESIFSWHFTYKVVMNGTKGFLAFVVTSILYSQIEKMKIRKAWC
jgi:hypothetical protein